MEGINYWNKEQKERIIKLLKIVFEETKEETNEESRNNKSDSIRTSNREDSLQD